ncbi:hypothetical protein ACFC06_07430 [Nocardia sp. NPDC056064]|uniref:hypothetical protein n=1 Tax=Nocardia sp. NPDC056064 TaxID=3345701 RepID=UPI0035E2ACCE
MGRDYEPPVRDRDDIALRPVHRPPRIRGEREPRPAGSPSRVSEDVLGLDERTDRAEGEPAARGSRTDAERRQGERRAREEDRSRTARPRGEDARPSRPHPEEPRGTREGESRRAREHESRRAREAEGRDSRGEGRDSRGEGRESSDRRDPSGEAGRSRGDRARGPRPAGGQGERRTRGPRPEQARRGLREQDHGPRLEHDRGQDDPRRQPRPAKPRLSKPTRPVKAARPDRPDDAADRAMGTGRAAKSKARPDRRQGPSLLDDATRARYEMIQREQSGLRAAWATFRLHTDDLRRNNAQARSEAVVGDGFDRTTAELTDRGYSGPGGGKMNVVGRPVEYRATTAQVAGLWPWSVGAGAPLIGTPLGSHLHTGAPVCFDPMNWFMRGSFITAPSLFVLGLNGFGKSSLVRRIVLGGIAQGITPLILADVKPDYRKMVELVGGQVIDLGYGHGKLNPLAAGVLGAVVPRLTDFPALQQQVLQDLRARQVTLIAGLVELVRGARVADFEETLIATALRILYQPGRGFTPDKPPIMENLLEVIIGGGPELMLDAGADDDDEYQHAIKNLRRSLRALTQGPFGAIFNGQTSVPIDTGAVAVCIDVSHIPTGDKKLKAAVMLACWADGFASVEAAHVLADAKLGPQRYFQVVMDELWQVLGLGDFMVDRVDELTRLQRGLATALIMISHTIKDLQALGSDAAIAKAIGFLERARAKIFGALPAEELSRLDSTVPFTSAEQEMVTGWSAPQALTGEALRPGQQRPSPPGTGKFLLKIGEDRRPGIPFHMEFTVSEKESGIHDTNQRFSEFGDNPRGAPDPSANGGQP